MIKDDRTFGQKCADAVATFGGSWTFVIIFACVLFAWVTLNSLQITHIIHWDQYPFILLNLFLSFIAAFQAPIIMMSQNRQSEIDRKRQIEDLEIDKKAEKVIEEIQEKVNLILSILTEVNE